MGSLITNNLESLLFSSEWIKKNDSFHTSFHITHPNLSFIQFKQIIKEAESQQLNLNLVTSILNLLNLKNLNVKLKILAKSIGTCPLGFNNFIDPYLDRGLIISELVNLNAHSWLIVKNGYFKFQQNSILSFFENSKELNDYFNSMSFQSSQSLYEETMKRVFILLSFIDSLSYFIKSKGVSSNEECQFLNNLYNHLSCEDINEIKNTIKYSENLLNSDEMNVLINIIWLNEDPCVKYAFSV